MSDVGKVVPCGSRQSRDAVAETTASSWSSATTDKTPITASTRHRLCLRSIGLFANRPDLQLRTFPPPHCFYGLRIPPTNTMSLVSRRALSTLIPPKVSAAACDVGSGHDADETLVAGCLAQGIISSSSFAAVHLLANRGLRTGIGRRQQIRDGNAFSTAWPILIPWM